MFLCFGVYFRTTTVNLDMSWSIGYVFSQEMVRLSNLDRARAIGMVQSGTLCHDVALTFGVNKSMITRLMTRYRHQNSILSDSQYGFRKGRSADLAILTLTEKCYESVEKDEFLIGIFLDLSKAFDTLSHTILLEKLSYYGFRGIASDWIANYLTSRKQFVSYNNYDSYVSDVKNWCATRFNIGTVTISAIYK